MKDQSNRLPIPSETRGGAKLGEHEKTLHDTLQLVYPASRKSNTKKIWEQKGYAHATEQGKTQYQTLTQGRQKLMEKVAKLDKKIDKSTRQNTLRVTLIAWKEAHIFLKKEKTNIVWAEHPIINLTPERKRKKNKAILEYYDVIKTQWVNTQYSTRNLVSRIRLHTLPPKRNISGTT